MLSYVEQYGEPRTWSDHMVRFKQETIHGVNTYYTDFVSGWVGFTKVVNIIVSKRKWWRNESGGTIEKEVDVYACVHNPTVAELEDFINGAEVGQYVFVIQEGIVRNYPLIRGCITHKYNTRYTLLTQFIRDYNEECSLDEFGVPQWINCTNRIISYRKVLRI